MDAQTIRELLDYSPESGEFLWRSGPRKGLIAGCICGAGYRYIRVCGKLRLAHRLAWLHHYGEPPSGQIDHVNQNKADNRITNLRCASHSENQRNRGKLSTNTSGYKGVHFCKFTSRYMATIWYDGKHQFIGRFDTPEEAYKAYCNAAEQYHGDYACTG